MCHVICVGNSVHQLKCCAMPEFSYSPHCERDYSGAGQPIDCRDFFYDSIVKGQCHSGTSEDCEFQWGMVRYNVIECCQASYQGESKICFCMSIFSFKAEMLVQI